MATVAQPAPRTSVPAALRRYLGPGIGLVVLAVCLAWVGYKASSDPATWIIVTLAALTLAGLYFVVASGFTLIFGLMRVVNLAHGGLYLLAGYIGYEIQQHGAMAWGWGVLVSVLAAGLVGLVMQQLFLRWNQGQDLRQAIITIAVAYILADQMLAWFGGVAEDVRTPSVLSGVANLHVYHLTYSWYRLFVLGFAVLIGISLILLIHRTRFGMIVRAGVDDRQMVSALGINVQVVFGSAFFLGSALAGLGGALAASFIDLAPGQDALMLLKALIVVIIGGMGSLGGAAVGAILLAFVEQWAPIYLPAAATNYSILLTFLLLVFVLAIRPLGLFGRPA